MKLPQSPGKVLVLFDAIASSVFFFLYQYSQLSVMSKISEMEFSILTPVVKAVMIFACSLYFGDPFGWRSLVGICITTGGGYCFTKVSKPSGTPKTHLLPVAHSE